MRELTNKNMYQTDILKYRKTILMVLQHLFFNRRPAPLSPPIHRVTYATMPVQADSLPQVANHPNQHEVDLLYKQPCEIQFMGHSQECFNYID